MYKTLLSLSIFLPSIASAQSFNKAVLGFMGYVNQAIPLIFGLILLAFFWNAAIFIRRTGEGKELEEAKNRLFWGVIALFVALAFWGIIQVFTSDLFNENPNFGAPQVDTDKIDDLFPKS